MELNGFLADKNFRFGSQNLSTADEPSGLGFSRQNKTAQKADYFP
jgi:hypothetical protein